MIVTDTNKIDPRDLELIYFLLNFFVFKISYISHYEESEKIFLRIYCQNSLNSSREYVIKYIRIIAIEIEKTFEEIKSFIKNQERQIFLEDDFVHPKLSLKINQYALKGVKRVKDHVREIIRQIPKDTSDDDSDKLNTQYI